MGTSDTFRAFVALPLPGDALDAVLSLQDRLERRARSLKSSPRWLRREQMHVTLKFLGQIERAGVSLLAGALDAAAECAPIDSALGDLDAFPSPRRARVIVAGFADPVGRLGDLAAKIDEAAEALDVESERRPFRAHVTLARLKPPGNVQRCLEGVEPEPTAVRFDRLCLYESELTPGGARYTVLHEARFRR